MRPPDPAVIVCLGPIAVGFELFGAPNRFVEVLNVVFEPLRQVLFAVTGSGTRIFNASSGNGEDFTFPDGTPAVAYTPTGDFSVLRRIEGMDEGPLGTLYRPLYFYDGWAVHGSSYVPAYPASHGCVRVANSDQDWIWDNMANGTSVTIY